MGKSDKTKDEGIVGERATNNGEIHAEQACCADGACCWEKTSKQSVEEKGS